MKFKKVSAALLAAMLVAGSFAACSSTDDETSSTASTAEGSSAEAQKIELTVWGPQEDQAPMDGYDNGILAYMCEKFNEEHPEWDITFEYGVCGEGDAKDTVTKDVEAAADVYMFANDQIPVLVEAGALARLGGDAEAAVKSDNDAIIQTSVTYEGAVYGVPFTSNTWFMYYDKSKFSEEEVKSLDTMMAKDLGDGVSNFAFPMTNSWYVEGFYYAAGGTLFGENGDDPDAGCDWNNENGVAATKYMLALSKNPKFSNELDGSSIAKFQEGKLGAYCSGSWDAAAIKEALGDNFGVTKLPTININGTDGQMRSFAGSKCIGVNPNCENTEVAVALASYLGNAECQQIRFETRGIIPSNEEVLASDAVKADAVAQAQAATISETSKVQPVLTAMNSYWTPAENMGKEIIQGDVTEDNAAEKTQAMVDGILSSGL